MSMSIYGMTLFHKVVVLLSEFRPDVTASMLTFLRLQSFSSSHVRLRDFVDLISLFQGGAYRNLPLTGPTKC